MFKLPARESNFRLSVTPQNDRDLSGGSANAGVWPLGLDCGKLTMMMIIIIMIMMLN
jgi:hypothetical protein